MRAADRTGPGPCRPVYDRSIHSCVYVLAHGHARHLVSLQLGLLLRRVLLPRWSKQFLRELEAEPGGVAVMIERGADELYDEWYMEVGHAGAHDRVVQAGLYDHARPHPSVEILTPLNRAE